MRVSHSAPLRSTHRARADARGRARARAASGAGPRRAATRRTAGAMSCARGLLLVGAAGSCLQSSATRPPAQPLHGSNLGCTRAPHWNDTDGQRIEAHAAGMLQSSTDYRWYWYGESKKDGNLRDHGVNCYSAPGLSGPWRNEGQVFHQSDVRVHDSTGPFVIERPKVLYNKATKKYVMWFHLDTAGYKYRHVGVATFGAEPRLRLSCWLQARRSELLDMSLFLDPLDGQAYHIRSCDDQYVGISRLT